MSMQSFAASALVPCTSSKTAAPLRRGSGIWDCSCALVLSRATFGVW